ncbi:MAG: Archaeal ATPase family protein [Gammaproteobacteria bacterium]|nr:Archaeal ATPase family protein [Gammaproteobacteria bacterium]
MSEFIGRTHELETLRRFLQKKTASLIVVKGRRRIGKSRLIEEFAMPYKFYAFSGIPPTLKTTAQSQRDEFASQLNKHNFPKMNAGNWNDLFWILADKVKKGRVIILFDEISWMGSFDPDFLGKLKNAWDLYFKTNPQLILVLCGSASSWIEKNILGSTGFVGRVSFTLTVPELPLNDCKAFWGKKYHLISAMERLKILSVTGGVPRYLEEIDPRLNAEENIKNLCFTKGALLTDEFNRIFSSLFLRNSESYQKIVNVLSMGDKEFSEICKALNTELSGRILEYLEELELSGFVKRDYTWHLQSGEDAKLSKYRLSDNYLRFYLKYIDKYKTKIERDSFNFKSLAALPGWDSIIALQFENLVLNNRQYIWQILGIKSEDIISENPFFQHKTTRQLGCQIDYMIQTRFGSLYICEIKFSKHPIDYNIIDEMEQKIKKLKRPKGLSCRPVLIHVNGIHNSVVESSYFSDIIDFSQIFEGR